jgi:hypothetical protein
MTVITRLHRALRRAPETLVWDYRRARAYFEERPHRVRFEEFVRGLPRRPRTLFMFFTTGLLHFVCKNLEFVPESEHVVLVGAALSESEREWIRGEIKRPFHHIDIHVDDRVVWEFLFATARADFGWLDVDCFVQNPRLFGDLFAFERDVAINCVWSYRTHGGHRMLCTHLLAVQHAVKMNLRNAGVSVSPSVYSFEPKRRSAYRHSYTRRPSASHVRLIRTLLPANDEGRPAYPSQIPEKGHLAYFDTLTMYQLCAEAKGYRLHAVRDLQGTNTLERHFSDEVIHINAASYYRGFKNSGNAEYRQYHRMLLPFDYLLLRSLAGRLPRDYQARLEEMERDLVEVQIPREGLGRNVRAVFQARGVSDGVFAREAWQFLED